jgi:hypothetical protein
MNSDDLAGFLIALSLDPMECESVRQRPNAVLEHTRLSPEERALVVSGDASRISRALSADQCWFPVAKAPVRFSVRARSWLEGRSI